MALVKSSRYGKDNVRICKVERDEETGVQTVTEMTMGVMLEGAINSSYTQGDNSVIIATDSMKNAVYIKAKENPVSPPELFACILGDHFIGKYPHLTGAQIKIITHQWARMNFDGKPHPHSFYKDGDYTQVTKAKIQKNKIEISSGINGLPVFKSTGSQFHGFVRDEFTTLPEAWDRVLSTHINCIWTWKPFETMTSVRAAAPHFDKAWLDVRDITMKIFAQENSHSVQNTMYNMSNHILQTNTSIQDVEYKLPNKHYNKIDLSWYKGLQDTGENAEIYLPQTDPNGLIELKVTRSQDSSEP
ncbi:hypothetical protein Golomagni_00970 [Golovinomyces magnicellulatus]|nr:hypothetical protein Golomagni_00970 [Golovinomyces magnicellulatus]